MTVDEHVRLGLALGYPKCCVAQFAADRILDVASAVERGFVTIGRREGPATVFHLDGRPLDHAGEEIVYVPCDDCMGPHTAGWQSHDGLEMAA